MMDSHSFLPLANFKSTYSTIYVYNTLSISALFPPFGTIITLTFLVKNLVAQILPIPSPRLLLMMIKWTELYTTLSKAPLLLSQKEWNDSIKSDERCSAERCSADWTSTYCLAATISDKIVDIFTFLTQTPTRSTHPVY